MFQSQAVFKKAAAVLSFQRGFVMSDALLLNVLADGGRSPVQVVRHGIRGTQNVNKAAKAEASSAGDAKRQEVSNIQETDSAKLHPDAVAMEAQFAIRFLNLDHALFACAPGKDDADFEAFRASIVDFIARAKQSDGLQEVARRYARNILNGRWLWRNRLLAKSVHIRVQVGEGEAGLCLGPVDALALPLNAFGDYSAEEQSLGQQIAAGLSGAPAASLYVSAHVDFGLPGAVEVFPSQNYLSDKPRGFARSLYCVGKAGEHDKTLGIRVMGQAALRDQKVANAIRTIDTWYGDYELNGRKPIAIEPNGASLEAQRFFRNIGDKKKSSAFDIIKQLNITDPASPEGLFFIACLVRGGVFSAGNDA